MIERETCAKGFVRGGKKRVHSKRGGFDGKGVGTRIDAACRQPFRLETQELLRRVPVKGGSTGKGIKEHGEIERRRARGRALKNRERKRRSQGLESKMKSQSRSEKPNFPRS